MALRKTITIEASEAQPRALHNLDGYAEVVITAPKELADAYIRVTRVDAGRGTATAYLEARTSDASAHVCNLGPVQFAHDRTSQGAEITTQAYGAAKLADFYAGAEDC